MRFEELKQSLKEHVYPIYLLEGEDGFFRERGKNYILSCIEEPQLNYTRTDGLTVKGNIDSFVADLKVCPFMSEKRLVEVTDWTPTAAELKGKSIKEYFANPCPTTILLIVNSSSCDALKKQPNVTVVNCGKADDAVIARYIRSQASKSGVIVSTSVCNKISEYCQNDMTRIAKETEKLIDYSQDEKEITEDAVDMLVARDTDYKTYQIVEFIARRNYDSAYRVVSEINAPSEKQILFVSLYYHIRRMFYSTVDKGSAGSVAQLLSVQEFAVKKAREQAAMFTPKRLKKIMETLARYDSEFKSGRISADNAFYNGVFTVLCKE